MFVAANFNSVAPNRTITIGQGTFDCSFTITIAIQLVGAGNLTVLNCTGGAGITIRGLGKRSATLVQMSALSITGANGTSVSVSQATLDIRQSTLSNGGGGVSVLNGQLTSTNLWITGNAGSGLSCVLSSCKVYSNLVEHNNAYPQNGGGMMGISSNILIANHTTLRENAAANGGGAYFVNCTVTMADDEVSDNTASGSGGGLYLENSQTYVSKQGKKSYTS